MALRNIRVITLSLTPLFSFLWTGPAWASFHLWKIDQVYSNASGTVQFVEFADTDNGETLVGGKTLTSSGQTFTFPSDLPVGTLTAGHHMLLATPGYGALNGVAKADFTLPAHFLNTSGDRLTYANGLDSVSFSGGQLPTDGQNALLRPNPTLPPSIGLNSPTDLAGNSGQISPWENQNNPLDVDGNTRIEAHDVGFIINDLLDHGMHSLPPVAPSAVPPPPFLDVNGDNFVRPSDVIMVINFLLDNPPQVVATMETVSRPAMSMAMASATIQGVPEPTSEALAIIAGLFGSIWIQIRRRRPVKAPRR